MSVNSISEWKLPNSIRKTIHIIWEKMFDPWWAWYYKYFEHPPKYHCKDDPWILKHWDENPYEPTCFPLPLWINCFGCRGCSHVKNPPFSPDKSKGPYKVMFHPIFLEQYESMFDKQAVFDLVWELQKRNNSILSCSNLEESREGTA